MVGFVAASFVNDALDVIDNAFVVFKAASELLGDDEKDLSGDAVVFAVSSALDVATRVDVAVTLWAEDLTDVPPFTEVIAVAVESTEEDLSGITSCMEVRDSAS